MLPHHTGCWPKLIALSLVALLVNHGLADEGAPRLQWQLRPHDRLHSEVTEEHKTTTIRQGQTTQSDVRIGMWIRWDVQEVSQEGQHRFTQIVDRMTMEQESPNIGRLVYDSSAQQQLLATEDTVTQSLRDFVGLEFMQTMNRRGEILALKLSEQGETALRSLPPDSQLRNMLSQDHLKRLVQQICILPENPVQPGDTWTTKTIEMTPFGQMQLDSLYTYLGPEEFRNRLLEKIGMEWTVTPVARDSQPVDIVIQNQHSTGLLYFDPDAGHLREATVRQEIALEARVAGQVEQQTVRTASRMQLVRVPAEPAVTPP